MMNLQSQSDQIMQRIDSRQPMLNVRQQPADTRQHQSEPIAQTLNPDRFSVAESALLLGAFVALVTSILSFSAL